MSLSGVGMLTRTAATTAGIVVASTATTTTTARFPTGATDTVEAGGTK